MALNKDLLDQIDRGISETGRSWIGENGLLKRAHQERSWNGR